MSRKALPSLQSYSVGLNPRDAADPGGDRAGLTCGPAGGGSAGSRLQARKDSRAAAARRGLGSQPRSPALGAPPPRKEGGPGALKGRGHGSGSGGGEGRRPRGREEAQESVGQDGERQLPSP